MNFVEPLRTRSEIDSILLQFNGKLACRNRLLFLLGATSALRVSDLLSLQWSFLLAKSGGEEKFKETIEIKESKTGKTKKFPLIHSVVSLLKEWRAMKKGVWIFTSLDSDEPISRIQAWRILSKAGERAGIEGIGTHSMRKTWGYHARNAGIPLPIIMDALNHSSESATLRYLGFAAEEVHNAYETVGSIFE